MPEPQAEFPAEILIRKTLMTMTELIITCIVLVVAVLLAAWFYVRWRKRHLPGKVSANRGRQAMDLLQKWLKELNCKYEVDKKEETSVVRFDYQSGHFQALIDDDSEVVTFRYLFIFTTQLEKLEIVRSVCNGLNTRVDMVKMVYSFDRDKNEVYVHVLVEMPVVPGASGLKAVFTDGLARCFSTQFLFMREFDDEVKHCKESGTEDLETSLASHKRELFLLREQEFSHQSHDMQLRPNADEVLKLGRLVSLLFGQDAFVFNRLVVADADGHAQVLTEKLADFNLLSPFLMTRPEGGEPEFKETDVVLQLSFTMPDGVASTLVISLKPEGRTDTTCYVRLTCCIPARGINVNVSEGGKYNRLQAHSLLVAYDLQSSQKQRQEFEYMWQDAKDKALAGKEEEMTDEQWLMLAANSSNVAQALYRGRQLMHGERYFEALLYLENAYDDLQSRFQTLGNQAKDRFYELCYFIGFCYCELERYEQAYFYLDIVFQLNRVIYTQEYINCLVNSGDFRALYVIDRLLSDIRKDDGGDKEEDEGDGDKQQSDSVLQHFINFLRRRRGYVLVDMGRLDEAEKMFREMLNEEDNSDYALEELAYIQRLKEAGERDKESKSEA